MGARADFPVDDAGVRWQATDRLTGTNILAERRREDADAVQQDFSGVIGPNSQVQNAGVGRKIMEDAHYRRSSAKWHEFRIAESTRYVGNPNCRAAGTAVGDRRIVLLPVWFRSNRDGG